MRLKLVIAVIITALFIGGGFLIWQIVDHDNGTTVSKVQYTCPMHPQIISDKFGSCPICGMDLVPVEKEAPVKYTCPMHPQIISDKFGSCPICGMDLVPVEKETTQKIETHDHAMPKGYAAITLSQKQADMLGVTYETVGIQEIAKEIVTSATIAANEEKTYKINIKVSGWVEKLYVNQTGQYVRQGSPLFAIYSPDLYASTLEYISIIRSIEQLNTDDTISDVLVNLKKAARDRLKLYGLLERQIAEIEKTKQVQQLIHIYSPYSGFVIEKNIYQGQKVMPNDTLMTIVDLSTVWALADIYQPDLPFIKIGMPSIFRIPYWDKKEYRGRVQFVYPFVNEQTRTVKVRVVLNNSRHELKPGLYAELILRYSAGRRLAVSEQAVFKTGKNNFAFVKQDDGTLMPQEIVVGALGSNGFYEVLQGVKKGDVIVSPANFLIDSESQLRAVFKDAAKSHQH